LDHATLVILEIAIATTFAGLIAGYGIYRLKKPKSYFRVWTSDGGELSYRIKRLGSHFTWTDTADAKRQVKFPLDRAYARRAPNGGLRFMGDPKTGSLMYWNQNDNAWAYMDPKYAPTALNDGRVLQIAKAMKGPQPWEQYILPGLIVLGIVAMATLYFVYKMYTGFHGAH